MFFRSCLTTQREPFAKRNVLYTFCKEQQFQSVISSSWQTCHNKTAQETNRPASIKSLLVQTEMVRTFVRSDHYISTYSRICFLLRKR